MLVWGSSNRRIGAGFKYSCSDRYRRELEKSTMIVDDCRDANGSCRETIAFARVFHNNIQCKRGNVRSKSEGKRVAELVRRLMWFALLSMFSVLIASTENGRNCDCL